ncbi:MAG TPA: hypothetical protein VFP40_01990, partial [Terriglobales bacterium]|nr:hypothetical protein [Terriglobales bacterium]
VVALFRPTEDRSASPRSVGETFRGMLTVMRNARFTALILITAGFWAIQGQLYASMPDYVIRMAGETYKPEWYANINPLVVVLGVVIYALMSYKKSKTADAGTSVIPEN